MSYSASRFAHAGPTPSPYGGAMPSSPYTSAYAGNGAYTAGFQSMGQAPYGGFRAGYGAGVAPAYGAQPSAYGAQPSAYGSPSFQTPGGNTYGAGYTAGTNPYTDTRAAGANPYAGLYAGRGVQPVNTLASGSAQRYSAPAAHLSQLKGTQHLLPEDTGDIQHLLKTLNNHLR